MQNKLEILIPDGTYHVFNRAVGQEPLFRTDNNYYYFLNRYYSYISPLAETISYCLMPNHFHFLIRIKGENEILSYLGNHLKKNSVLDNLKENSIGNLISQQFSHLFNGYTQAFNKENNRKGALFMRPYKRIFVKDENYLKKLVHYIHLNPVDAKLCLKPEDWTFSSYPSIIQNKNIFFNTENAVSLFDSLKNFKTFHSLSPILESIE